MFAIMLSTMYLKHSRKGLQLMVLMTKFFLFPIGHLMYIPVGIPNFEPKNGICFTHIEEATLPQRGKEPVRLI
jgi:hypothetical protein